MRTIDARTQVCAVFGHPIGHSLSPAIHNAAFAALDLPFVYVAHDVAPGCVARALEGIRVMGYRGLSITIPHKVEAMHAVDEVDETARSIGCINTVVNERGRLLGYNSDGLGALGALRDAGANPEGTYTVLLGSGGAARAIALTLACQAPPKQLIILGIDRMELEALVSDVRAQATTIVAGEMLTEQALEQAPVGMHPDTERTLVPRSLLHDELVVFDAVYNPRKTRLLQDAEQSGCDVVPGLEMFLGQAYVQFQFWTGKPAPRDVMRQVVEANL
jgi:shikimate dehydrogenase